MKKLKLFEDFEEENDGVILPGDEDYDYVDLTDDEEFSEYKNEIFADFKYSSEKIIDIIGHENEEEWFKLVNNIDTSKDNDELQGSLTDLREFLSNFDIQRINAILNDED